MPVCGYFAADDMIVGIGPFSDRHREPASFHTSVKDAVTRFGSGEHLRTILDLNPFLNITFRKQRHLPGAVGCHLIPDSATSFAHPTNGLPSVLLAGITWQVDLNARKSSC
jgi:hypothetical protein